MHARRGDKMEDAFVLDWNFEWLPGGLNHKHTDSRLDSIRLDERNETKRTNKTNSFIQKQTTRTTKQAPPILFSQTEKKNLNTKYISI